MSAQSTVTSCASSPCPSPHTAFGFKQTGPNVEGQALLSRRDAAKYLGVKPQTLAAWACSKRVLIPYTKLGRRVMYRRDDLDRFVQANLQFGTDEEVAS